MKEDLRHLKWTLINKDGCTPEEASTRINELKQIMRNGKETKEMQQKIIDCLTKAGEPLGRSEIAARLKCRPITISDRIRKLVKCNDIECIEISREQAMERFGAKRRMKLYYCKN